MATITAPAELAAHDQVEAAERELERKVARIGCVILALFFALGAYSWLGLHGLVPAPPWSPVAQVDQVDPGPPAPPVEAPPAPPPADADDGATVDI